MKKLIALLLVLVMALTMVACAAKDSTPKADTPANETKTDVPATNPRPTRPKLTRLPTRSRSASLPSL